MTGMRVHDFIAIAHFQFPLSDLQRTAGVVLGFPWCHKTESGDAWTIMFQPCGEISRDGKVIVRCWALVTAFPWSDLRAISPEDGISLNAGGGHCITLSHWSFSGLGVAQDEISLRHKILRVAEDDVALPKMLFVAAKKRRGVEVDLQVHSYAHMQDLPPGLQGQVRDALGTGRPA